jgi:hypothetical protein
MAVIVLLNSIRSTTLRHHCKGLEANGWKQGMVEEAGRLDLFRYSPRQKARAVISQMGMNRQRGCGSIA